MTPEQRALIEEYAYLESDTPGTVEGVSKSGPRPSAKKRQQEEEQEKRSQEEDVSQEKKEQEEGFFAKWKKKLLG